VTTAAPTATGIIGWMTLQPTTIRRRRTDADGCRRYRVSALDFDTRVLLDIEIDEEWEEHIKESGGRTDVTSAKVFCSSSESRIQSESSPTSSRSAPAPGQSLRSTTG